MQVRTNAIEYGHAAANRLAKRLIITSDNDIYHTLLADSIPKPYPLQDEIIGSSAKRKVICAGRRAGKTQLAAIRAIQVFMEGKVVLLASTSQDQADVFWRRLKDWTVPLQAKGLHKNETVRVLTFGTGRLRVKTGSDADVLRGEDADLLILDECARLSPEAWYEVGAPMLADRDGEAWFISTPKRRNWFYYLYQRAEQEVRNGNERWAAWHFTTLANPFLNETAVGELTADMTEDAYKQEILAEFLEDAGAVFRNIRECATAAKVEPYEGRFVVGLDWAQKSDYTCAIVMDMDKRCVVDIARFNEISWAVQRGRIAALYEKWHPQTIIAEANSIGSPNIEALQGENLPVQSFMTTAQSKPPLIESLVLAFERKEIAIPDDGVLIGELSAYERKVSQSTGRSQYSAPEGMHDDTVIALALAWHGVAGPQPWIMGFE